MSAKKNGNDTEETIAAYLAEAKRCEQFAALADDEEEREDWNDLAERWRALAATFSRQ